MYDNKRLKSSCLYTCIFIVKREKIRNKLRRELYISSEYPKHWNQYCITKSRQWQNIYSGSCIVNLIYVMNYDNVKFGSSDCFNKLMWNTRFYDIKTFFRLCILNTLSFLFFPPPSPWHTNAPLDTPHTHSCIHVLENTHAYRETFLSPLFLFFFSLS